MHTGRAKQALLGKASSARQAVQGMATLGRATQASRVTHEKVYGHAMTDQGRMTG
jgi:hypothetical protein